jgi:hypothetical protein
VTEGGGWTWCPGGVAVSGEQDWTALAWTHLDGSILGALRRLSVEVTISGDAGAAGLSLGPYKDFLTKMSGGRSQRMRLDLDTLDCTWTCTVNGSLVARSWWDSGISRAADLQAGCLCFKAHRPGTVRFEDLVVRWLESPPQISVILVCHRFLQRLRMSLRNWCHQEVPSGALEILVVNPQSPDGTHEHLSMVSRVFDNVRVIELPGDADLARNKGALLNQAVEHASGAWVWLTDADCVFPPPSAALVLREIGRNDGGLKLYYGRRRHLAQDATEGLLAGRHDAIRDYDLLAGMTTADEAWPWGYTQILPRSLFRQIRYDEDQNHFAHSDGLFLRACQQRGIPIERVAELECLHLVHPFVWFGNDGYL